MKAITMKTAALLFTVLFILSNIPHTLAENAHTEKDLKQYEDIVIPYTDIFSALTDGHPTARAEKIIVEGESAMRFTPDTDSYLYTVSEKSKALSLDSWALSKYNIDLKAYKYVTVNYEYNSVSPQSGKAVLHLLPQKVLKKRADFLSDCAIISGKKAELTFDLGDITPLFVNEKNTLLSQIHFFPFGDVTVNMLSPEDELIIYSVVFSVNDPVSDRKYSVIVDGKETTHKPYDKFILPTPKSREGEVFKGYIPASNAASLVMPGTEITVTDNLIFTSMYLPHEKEKYDDIVFGSFKSYYSCIVDGVDSGFADTDGEFLSAVANPNAKFEGPLKLDGWDYGGLRISALCHKYAYVLMRVDGADGVVPVMNVMRSDVFTSQTPIKSETTLQKGQWSFAEFDVSPLSQKLLDSEVNSFIKQIHFLPFGSINARDVPKNAKVYIDKIIFSSERLDLTLHDSMISGYSDGSFRPEGHITRAEAATLAARLVGLENSFTDKDGQSFFRDVESGDWFYGSVNALAEVGILGREDLFRPNDIATRAEICDMIYATGVKKSDIHKSFPDVYPYDKYYNSVRYAAGAGIINGYSDGTFRPYEAVTRAEAVRITANAIDRHAHVELFQRLSAFTDVNDGHWCRDDILELSVRHIMSNGEVLVTNAAERASGYNGGASEKTILLGNAKKAETDELFEKRKEEILSSKSTVTISGNSYYVSNNGNDSNDGLSPQTPWKTVKKVNSARLVPGDGVFFERGGIWREQLICAKGVSYSAYGEGKKPSFYGSPENGGGEEKWTLVEGTENIWRFHSEMRDVGGIVLEGGKDVFEKVVAYLRNGVFYTGPENTLFDVKIHLKEDLTFFSDIPEKDLKGENAYGYVYLRCDKGNPGLLFSDLEFITTGHSVYFPHADTVIENLCALYSHGGINGSNNVINATIKNCEVGFIGGNLQGYDVFGGSTGSPTRYGNGINFYGACDGYFVYDNYVHDIYDAGISNQYQKGGNNPIRNDNIVYSGNVIERCCYGIEYFMGIADSNVIRIMTDLTIKDNIIRDSGYGFGRKNPTESAAIKGWDHNNHSEDFKIENNIFCNSYGYLYHIGAGYSAWLPTFNGNVYIQRAGGLFGKFGKNPTTLYTFDYTVTDKVPHALSEPSGEYYMFSE